MHPKNPFDPFPQGSSSLPLLVRMPDGERRQVDVSANASVRDLKDSIAPIIADWSSTAATSSPNPATSDPTAAAEWDLDFGGSVLNDTATLGDYHIPDAYDHASGLLRTISGSAHADAGKKVEALDKACAVVAGISRGERDMERLIAAVFDDENPVAPADDTAQPSIRSMKRRGRSRIPSLNFSQLPPPGQLPAKASPRAPPTPSQLIRRLSSSRPDLYNPAAAARAGDANPPAPGASGELKKQSSWFTEAAAMGAPDHSASTTNQPTATAATPSEGGSGVLKRGNTWFNGLFSAFGSSVAQQHKAPVDEDSSEGEPENDDLGASEDEQPPIKKRNDGTPTTGKTDPITTPNTNTQTTENLDPKDTEKKGSVPQKPGETLNAAVNAAAAVAGGAKPTSNNASGTTAAAAATDVNKSANSSPSTSALTANTAQENATNGAQGNKPAGPTATNNGTSQPSSAAGVEPQVIGLNPEQPHPEEDIKLPKKRGRKRKNPHLSEEERKLQRQAQNRESAKLSRIRRKNMTAEYEKRVTTLEGENENLRDTVAALTDRLEILQNLLTISVQKRPVPTGPLAQSILPPQAAGQTMLPPGNPPGAPIIAPQTSMPQLHPHQLTNMNYKNF